MSNVITPEFRGSYVSVFHAKRNDLNDKMEYSIVALFPKNADLSKLKAAAAEAVKEKWGDKKPKNLRSPFRDQGEKERDGVLPAAHETGAIFMNFKSNQKPGIVDANREHILDESECYSGAWYRASVRAYAYENKGNCGVAFGLQNIQKVREDDPLSGRAKPEDEFEAVAGATTGAGVFD